MYLKYVYLRESAFPELDVSLEEIFVVLPAGWHWLGAMLLALQV